MNLLRARIRGRAFSSGPIEQEESPCVLAGRDHEFDQNEPHKSDCLVVAKFHRAEPSARADGKGVFPGDLSGPLGSKMPVGGMPPLQQEPDHSKYPNDKQCRRPDPADPGSGFLSA